MSENTNSKSIGPWTRLSQKQVYDNPWIQVTHEEVITPGGTEGIYGKVHFKSKAVGIVAIDKHHNVYLVGQYRYVLDEFSWEVPKGGADMNGIPLECAKRELKEETGLVAEKWQQLCKFHTSNSITDEVGFLFIAEGLTEGEQALEASEGDLIVKKVKLADAINMIQQQEITDLLSISALYAAKQYLENN